jgi:predicted nucleic acid-binding protein
MDDEEGAPSASFIDANLIVRYFMQDQPEVQDIVREIIEEHPQLLITEGTIAEVGFVLTRHYGVARAVVVDAILDLLARDNFSVYLLDHDLVVQALWLCRPSARVSFADAMLWASARTAGIGSTVYTHDRRFPSVGVDIRTER